VKLSVFFICKSQWKSSHKNNLNAKIPTTQGPGGKYNPQSWSAAWRRRTEGRRFKPNQSVRPLFCENIALLKWNFGLIFIACVVYGYKHRKGIAPKTHKKTLFQMFRLTPTTFRPTFLTHWRTIEWTSRWSCPADRSVANLGPMLGFCRYFRPKIGENRRFDTKHCWILLKVEHIIVFF
jgi:hypothetical protein